ncbi:hypothetical protein ACFQ5E_13370 [Oceanobacillus sojae]
MNRINKNGYRNEIKKRKIRDNPDTSIFTAAGEKKMICRNNNKHINNRSIFEKVQKWSLLLPKIYYKAAP